MRRIRTGPCGHGVAISTRARDPSALVFVLVARSLVPIGAGLVVGIAGALASSRLLTTLLFQVRPADPVVLSVIAGLLGCVATLACWIPARRAATVDPTIALRTEG